jgi:hypothetical protein
MLHRNTTVPRDDMVRATTTTTRSIAACLPVVSLRLLRFKGRRKRRATLVSGLSRNSATHLHPDASYHTYRHVRISMITVTAAMKAVSASVSA